MLLTERHIIHSNHASYDVMDKLCFLSKNLYNANLYAVRQHFFETKKYLDYYQISTQFAKEKQHDYKQLPAKVAQQTMKLVEQNFKSFFGLLKLKQSNQYDKQVKIPNYLDTVKGRCSVIYTIQAISKKLLKQNIVKLSGTDFSIKTNIDQSKHIIKQARLIPKIGHIVFEVVYEVKEKPIKDDNQRYLSIDLGLNNLATLTSNVIKPQIINGRPLKSINQHYNKQLAHLKSILKTTNNEHTSKHIQSITNNRNNKIKDYLHKVSRYIINHAVSNQINTIVIGYNKGWKQEINIGSVNNQNFVNIPFAILISQIQYKAKLEGLNVIVHEESYTSKCSFIDNEPVKKHKIYLGKRVKRGLFKSSLGKLINADVNGGLNILKKVIGDFCYPIWVCSTPLLVRLKL